MRMPGFTAQTLLSRTLRMYYMTNLNPAVTSGVVPAIPVGAGCKRVCNLAAQCNGRGDHSDVCQMYNYICNKCVVVTPPNRP